MPNQTKQPKAGTLTSTQAKVLDAFIVDSQQAARVKSKAARAAIAKAEGLFQCARPRNAGKSSF